MLPRRSEDYRTLLWTLVLTPLVVLSHCLRPDLGLTLLPLSCYFAIATGVIAHNHMHRPTLRAKWANELFSSWISVFYGYPVFAWLPTHNLNHHKLVNRRGDATITWRYTNKHNVFVAVSYFFVSAYFKRRGSRSTSVMPGTTSPRCSDASSVSMSSPTRRTQRYWHSRSVCTA